MTPSEYFVEEKCWEYEKKTLIILFLFIPNPIETYFLRIKIFSSTNIYYKIPYILKYPKTTHVWNGDKNSETLKFSSRILCKKSILKTGRSPTVCNKSTVAEPAVLHLSFPDPVLINVGRAIKTVFRRQMHTCPYIWRGGVFFMTSPAISTWSASENMLSH